MMTKNYYCQIIALILVLTICACSSSSQVELLAEKRKHLAEEQREAQIAAEMAEKERVVAEAAQRPPRKLEAVPETFKVINYDNRDEILNEAWAAHGVSELESSLVDIKAVRTGVYDPDTAIFEGFGYYLYLLIVDKSRSQSERRKAASYAFVCDLPEQDLFKNNDNFDFPIKNIALFLAPVSDKELIDIWHLGNNSPEEFLEFYDYNYASFLNDLIGSQFKSIGIVGLKKPIFPYSGENTNNNDTVYFDLSQKSPKEIEHVILRLRDIFSETEGYNKLAGNLEALNIPFHIKLADFFVSVDNFMGSINPIGKVYAEESDNIRDCSK